MTASQARGGRTATGTGARRRASTGTAVTDKAGRTRDQLLSAARIVFAREGYLDATVEQIVEQAGVARGSFYTYFESKVHVYRELSREHERALEEAHDFPRVPGASMANLEMSVRNYLELVRRNGDLFRLIRQVAAYDVEVRDKLMETHWVYVRLLEATIRRWQARGHADLGVDPASAAELLTSMMRGYAEDLYLYDASYDLDEAVVLLTGAYVSICGLRPSDTPG